MENDVKQNPGPQRKMRLLDEFFVGLHEATSWTTETGLSTEVLFQLALFHEFLITWYNVLAANLKHLIVWPSKEVIATNMPDCFKKFPNTRIIIDCTEFFHRDTFIPS